MIETIYWEICQKPDAGTRAHGRSSPSRPWRRSEPPRRSYGPISAAACAAASHGRSWSKSTTRLVPYVGVAAAINCVAACREVFNPRRAVRRIFPWWIGLTRNIRRQAMQTIFPAQCRPHAILADNAFNNRRELESLLWVSHMPQKSCVQKNLAAEKSCNNYRQCFRYLLWHVCDGSKKRDARHRSVSLSPCFCTHWPRYRPNGATKLNNSQCCAFSALIGHAIHGANASR